MSYQHLGSGVNTDDSHFERLRQLGRLGQFGRLEDTIDFIT